jgi:hypothetical protein
VDTAGRVAPLRGFVRWDGHINIAFFTFAATALLVFEEQSRLYEPTMLD